jgi:hypothetical protein
MVVVMDTKTQVNGLNLFLSVVFGEETRLSSLLADQGFRRQQLDLLREHYLNPLVAEFVELIKRTLTDGDADEKLFNIMSRCYGMDGEDPSPIGVAGQQLGLGPEQTQKLFDAALRRCRQKTWQTALLKGLHNIAIQQLESGGERPPATHVVTALQALGEFRTAAENERQAYETRRAEILKTVQPQLDALDAEQLPLLEAHDREIAKLEAEIKNDVLLLGATVQGPGIRAVYSRGRVTWDNRGLQQYSQLHPEVLEYRKVGNPIVVIRSTKGDSQDTES